MPTFNAVVHSRDHNTIVALVDDGISIYDHGPREVRFLAFREIRTINLRRVSLAERGDTIALSIGAILGGLVLLALTLLILQGGLIFFVIPVFGVGLLLFGIANLVRWPSIVIQAKTRIWESEPTFISARTWKQEEAEVIRCLNNAKETFGSLSVFIDL